MMHGQKNIVIFYYFINTHSQIKITGRAWIILILPIKWNCIKSVMESDSNKGEYHRSIVLNIQYSF